jgi:hypothetical protein
MNAAPDSNHPLLLGKRLDTTELPRDLRIRTVDDMLELTAPASPSAPSGFPTVDHRTT